MTKASKHEQFADKSIILQITLVELFAVALTSSFILIVFKLGPVVDYLTILSDVSASLLHESINQVSENVRRCPSDCDGATSYLSENWFRELAFISLSTQDELFGIIYFILLDFMPTIFSVVAGVAVWSLLHNQPIGILHNFFDSALYFAANVVAISFASILGLLFFVLNSYFGWLVERLWIPPVLGFFIGVSILMGLWEKTPIGELFSRHQKGKKIVVLKKD